MVSGAILSLLAEVEIKAKQNKYITDFFKNFILKYLKTLLRL